MYIVRMYIIAIAWLYVVILMAATEKSMTAALLTLLFYGLLPCALLLWLMGTKHRRHFQQKHLPNEDMRDPDRGDSKPD